MRVFREVVPQKKKESQPAVRYQEARIEKKMDGFPRCCSLAIRKKNTEVFIGNKQKLADILCVGRLSVDLRGNRILTFFSDGANRP